MKRVTYQWTEIRTILVPDEVYTQSYAEMIRDIHDKVTGKFSGSQRVGKYMDILPTKNGCIEVKKSDTKEWKILSVDPVEVEKPIDKARRLRIEYDDQFTCINVNDIFDAYEQAYKEDAGE